MIKKCRRLGIGARSAVSGIVFFEIKKSSKMIKSTVTLQWKFSGNAPFPRAGQGRHGRIWNAC
jgi:hypothetical protein